jgi:hypothetical protein
MRAITRLLPVLLAASVFACDGSQGLVAPPPGELSLALTFNPAQTGGIRPSTTVSALLYVENAPNAVVSGVVDRAEFTVLDARGAVLARETVAGPLAFGADATLTVRQVLDWRPADVLGRSLTVRFVIGSAAVERTFTF